MGDIFIIGGPNGAGKTTAARELLPQVLGLNLYLNADEIARQISPDDVDLAAFQAGREMLKKMRKLVRDGVSFAFESTLSGRSYLKLLKQWQTEGWQITLFYLWLPSPELSVQRVAQRVRSGGHGIPEETIRRRYLVGLRNVVNMYLPLANAARIYDNESGRRKLIVEKDLSGNLVIYDRRAWERIQEQIDEKSEPAGDIRGDGPSA